MLGVVLAALPLLALPPAAGFGEGARLGGSSGYLCKNGSSDWPLPCFQGQREQHQRFPFNFPISAWWGPIGYAEAVEHLDPRPTEEFLAYVAAGFNVLMVSDRGGDHCAAEDWRASWAAIESTIALGHAHNLSSLVDTYRCIPWGPPNLTAGGDADGAVNRWLSSVSDRNHVLTLPELQWLAPKLAALPGAAGVLLTDDSVSLARNVIEEVQWMREHTPTLLPWVNQCGDGTEWLARAGTPFAIPELYTDTYSGGSSNATLRAQTLAASQLRGFEAWTGKSVRFRLAHWPMIGDTSPGSPGQRNSTSLISFQALAAVAYGARGLFWYCWGEAMWSFEPHAGPTAIYLTVTEVNHRLGEGDWPEAIAQHAQWQGVFATGWVATELLPSGGQFRTMQQDATPSCTPKLPEFTARPHTPAADALVVSMDEHLLVGVLVAAESESTMLVIVDARVSDEFARPTARTIHVQLASTATSAGSVRVLTTASAVTVRYDALSKQLTATGIRGGDAIAVVLPGAVAAAAARSLRQWRYQPERPTLSQRHLDRDLNFLPLQPSLCAAAGNRDPPGQPGTCQHSDGCRSGGWHRRCESADSGTGGPPGYTERRHAARGDGTLCAGSG